MTAPHIVDPERLLGEAPSQASPDLMRSLLRTMVNSLLSAEADAVCGAECGQAGEERRVVVAGEEESPMSWATSDPHQTHSSPTARQTVRVAAANAKTYPGNACRSSQACSLSTDTAQEHI